MNPVVFTRLRVYCPPHPLSTLRGIFFCAPSSKCCHFFPPERSMALFSLVACGSLTTPTAPVAAPEGGGARATPILCSPFCYLAPLSARAGNDARLTKYAMWKSVPCISRAPERAACSPAVHGWCPRSLLVSTSAGNRKNLSSQSNWSHGLLELKAF